jgi:uncharacterized OB-fold protein
MTTAETASIAAVLRAGPTDTRIPFKDGFLHGQVADPESLRLAGSRCEECGIALWGVRRRCENCSSPRVREEVFAPTGVVHTYTVQRYAPPKPHMLAEPWTPRAVAWVDLDERGPRVLAPIDGPAERVRIGLPVRLRCHVGYVDEHEREVLVYAFEPAPLQGATA